MGADGGDGLLRANANAVGAAVALAAAVAGANTRFAAAAIARGAAAVRRTSAGTTTGTSRLGRCKERHREQSEKQHEKSS